jgi:hypothetical protein
MNKTTQVRVRGCADEKECVRWAAISRPPGGLTLAAGWRR